MAKWNEMPFVVKLGIIIGLAAAVCVSMYFVVFKSTYEENQQNLVQLKAKNTENERLKKQYEPRLQEVNRRVELLKQQLEIQKRIVPDEKEAANFIHLLQDKASSSGVEIRRYTANMDAVATREFYTEVPYEVELDGPYYAVLDFFQRVGTMERIINVSSLKMGAVSNPIGFLNSTRGSMKGDSSCTIAAHGSASGAPRARSSTSARARARVIRVYKSGALSTRGMRTSTMGS